MPTSSRELQLVDAGSRPGGGASQGEIHGPLKYIVRSAAKWGGNGVVPDFNKIKRVLTTKHPEVIAKAFGGDPNRAAAWIKDAWEKYYGRVLPGKSGAGPTYWRKRSASGHSTENDATMSREAVVQITLAGPNLTDQGASKPPGAARVPENPADKEPVACGTMDKGDYFKLPTYGLSLATPHGVAGVFRHLGQHPTRKTHISAKKLATGKLQAFHKSALVVPVPRPKVISGGPVEPSPFGGMNG